MLEQLSGYGEGECYLPTVVDANRGRFDFCVLCERGRTIEKDLIPNTVLS